VLAAAGLRSLITESVDAYERVALELARDSAAFQAVKDDLARNRDHCALFDTVRFTRNLERAFTTMWHRHQSGESPSSFVVDEHHD
jgi:predicted O-linked N-acetylglucosamine transferase (SPINDLY family)